MISNVSYVWENIQPATKIANTIQIQIIGNTANASVKQFIIDQRIDILLISERIAPTKTILILTS